MRATDSDYAAALARLEVKVDKLTDAVTLLVRVEERQVNQGVRLGDVEARVRTVEVGLIAVEKKTDQWINRGIGLWSVVVVAWTVYLSLSKYLPQLVASTVQ